MNPAELLGKAGMWLIKYVSLPLLIILIFFLSTALIREFILLLESIRKK